MYNKSGVKFPLVRNFSTRQMCIQSHSL